MKTESSPKSAGEAKAYPPSFVDRLMAWIERLPGSAWVYYLSVTLLFVVLSHGLRWMDGSLPRGTFDPLRLVNDSITVYGLAVMHYLNRTAGESLASFRPALGKLEAEYERLEAGLTRMSPRSFLIAFLFGFALTVLSLVSDPVAWGITPQSSLATNIFSVAQSMLASAPFFCADRPFHSTGSVDRPRPSRSDECQPVRERLAPRLFQADHARGHRPGSSNLRLYLRGHFD